MGNVVHGQIFFLEQDARQETCQETSEEHIEGVRLTVCASCFAVKVFLWWYEALHVILHHEHFGFCWYRYRNVVKVVKKQISYKNTLGQKYVNT